MGAWIGRAGAVGGRGYAEGAGHPLEPVQLAEQPHVLEQLLPLLRLLRQESQREPGSAERITLLAGGIIDAHAPSSAPRRPQRRGAQHWCAQGLVEARARASCMCICCMSAFRCPSMLPKSTSFLTPASRPSRAAFICSSRWWTRRS